MRTTIRINIYLVCFTSCVCGISKQTVWRLLSPELQTRHSCYAHQVRRHQCCVHCISGLYLPPGIEFLILSSKPVMETGHCSPEAADDNEEEEEEGEEVDDIHDSSPSPPTLSPHPGSSSFSSSLSGFKHNEMMQWFSFWVRLIFHNARISRSSQFSTSDTICSL